MKRPATQAKAKEAIAEMKDYCNIKGYNIETVLSRKRSAKIVEKRRDVAKFLRRRGYSLPAIGFALNRHHTSILCLICEETRVRRKAQMISYMNGRGE